MDWKKDRILFMGLMILWFCFYGEANMRMFLSGVIACAITILLYKWILNNSGAREIEWISPIKLVHFCGITLREIFKAAWQHFFRIISGNGETQLTKVELEVTDELAITLIANAITLTPGTLTLEIDKNNLLILGYTDGDQTAEQLIEQVKRLQAPFRR